MYKFFAITNTKWINLAGQDFLQGETSSVFQAALVQEYWTSHQNKYYSITPSTQRVNGSYAVTLKTST